MDKVKKYKGTCKNLSNLHEIKNKAMKIVLENHL